MELKEDPPSDNIFIISNSLILWKSITMKNTSLSTIETQYSNLIECTKQDIYIYIYIYIKK